MVGAIVLYEASPMPTIARKIMNDLYVGMYEPKNVVPLHRATPNIMIQRREYRSPK